MDENYNRWEILFWVEQPSEVSQTSGTFLYSYLICAILNLGPGPRMQMKREHGPFHLWAPLPGLLVNSFLPSSKKSWIFSTFSCISHTRNSGHKLMTSYWISAQRHTFPCVAPMTISFLFHFWLDGWKILNSQLKCNLLNFLLCSLSFSLASKTQRK